MSDETENSAPSHPAPDGKRPRLHGACDLCWRKKVRCDSAAMPGMRCTNCIASNFKCTHNRLEESKSQTETPPVEPPKTAQQLVAEILSTTTIYIPSNDPAVCHQLLVEVAWYARTLEEKVAILEVGLARPSSKAGSPPEDPPPAEASSSQPESALIDLISHPLVNLISTEFQHTGRFHGTSSSIQFIKTAMRYMHGDAARRLGVQRPEIWMVRSWDKLDIERPQLVFPENDVLEALLTIYFEQINPILGILHSPSFRRSIADGLHLLDTDFGAVVLAVCAVASRHSEDPRVILEEQNQHSCGWKYFKQVRPLRKAFPVEPSLHRLQLISLSIAFMAGASLPEESWILMGIGIRMAQSAGAHLRSGYSDKDPLEAELYKRVFWNLWVSDIIESSVKGRPPTVQPADVDIDLPVDRDEIYWGSPSSVQPFGKPSESAFLIVYLKLMAIFGRIQKIIYPVNGQLCSEDAVVELDSALNNWAGLIPEHLRWDPHQQNQIFLDQSTALYIVYYYAQIIIHRPLIPPPGKKSTTNFPSLAICANAARSCGHVLDVQTHRGRGYLHHPYVSTALFESAIVLLINVWDVVGGRHTATPEAFNRATADSQICVRLLRIYERRWQTAAVKGDIISALLRMGKSAADGLSLKRLRDSPNAALSSSDSSSLDPPPEARPIAGSARSAKASMNRQMEELKLSAQESSLFSLPLRTEELGNLPVYESFDYVSTAQPDGMFQPQPHSDPPYDADLIALDLFGLDSSSVGQTFAENRHGLGGGQLSHSVDITSGYSWSDWRAYLASLDAVGSGDAHESAG